MIQTFIHKIQSETSPDPAGSFRCAFFRLPFPKRLPFFFFTSKILFYKNFSKNFVTRD